MNNSLGFQVNIGVPQDFFVSLLPAFRACVPGVREDCVAYAFWITDPNELAGFSIQESWHAIKADQQDRVVKEQWYDLASNAATKAIAVLVTVKVLNESAVSG